MENQKVAADQPADCAASWNEPISSSGCHYASEGFKASTQSAANSRSPCLKPAILAVERIGYHSAKMDLIPNPVNHYICAQS